MDERVTVLVVDDSSAIRRILRRSLEGGGYRVTEAPDGSAALDSCRAEIPGLILLDLDMPVMDGPTALAALKRDELLRDIPVLILTARTSGSEVAAGLALGAADYLRKPCEAAELTARVGAALRQKQQQDALRHLAREADRLSTTDALTGLPNRRQLDLHIADLAAVVGPAAGVGLMVVDVDHFKAVNDTHGHLVGDIVLRILAGRLRWAVGPGPLLARWGGEEFVVMAPGLANAALVELAERLRVAVDGETFAIGGGRNLAVTVSIGCASADLNSVEPGLQAADEALYEAKRTGRNRVALYDADLAGH